MIRPQRVPGRYVHNQSSNETNSSSTNAGDITSYIGKILIINHHQVVVENILGQGGFAFVFLVRAYNQQRYALKRMYVNNQRDLHVCQREISLIKEFSTHPNIIKYIDSSINRLPSTNVQRRQYYPGENDNGNDEDDAIYEILLLTEYCANGALVTRLNEQHSVGLTLNEHQILRIFADVCHAVSACHFRRPQPILHRDIKLENILINSLQNYVLCDFGSAILLSASTNNDFQQYPVNQLTTNIIQQLEEEVQRYTTLSYRAPEMIDLYSRLPITLKADIWAMGCLLYKLMYNTMPFGDSILAIQNGAFVIPDDMAQTYRRELNLLVRYILEIDINKRPDIWQVSYLTYKLLGTECPIPNRCQSKIPDLKGVSMPLTDSEARYRRTNALSKIKSTSTNVLDESLPLGTAVNPRERPRGMMAPSTSLINFNQTPHQAPTLSVQPPPSSSSANPSRSGSAAQLMFDDDFSKIPSHAISLTSISTAATSSAANEQNISRVRPSPPPATVSTASGFSLQQQLFPLPPPPTASSLSASNLHAHRRSSSQTFSPTNIQSSFPIASSADLSNSQEASNDDNDAEEITTNFSKFKVLNISDLHADDDQVFLADNQKSSTKSISHHPSTEEAENKTFFPNSFDYFIVQHNQSKSDFQNHSNEHDLRNNTDNGFNRLVDDDSNAESYHHSTSSNNYANASNNSFADVNNPFLRAPFNRSSGSKQTLTSSSINSDRIITTTNSVAFDPNSIVIGKKASAFTPYQKQPIHANNTMNDVTSLLSTSMSKLPHSEAFPSDKSLSSSNVFTAAPFKAKSKNKQRPITPNKDDDMNNNPEQQGYSNLSFTDAVQDNYF
ncbi:unnamed protein product [Adineta ricciae]|uniref:non-specific serine/threonine protein kinase n=1 Tax=Adineta ricciae TaxID=249248 RepID=A0A814KMC1_ADIRI|nr:unnamed protein product [Adineta ricciae]CAF1286053.1 unnamed protein product [Adineta ricciae]